MMEEERLTTTVLQIISEKKKLWQQKMRANDVQKLHDDLVSVPLNAVQTGYRTTKELSNMVIVAEGIDHGELVLMHERIRSSSRDQRVGQELSNLPGDLSSTAETLHDFKDELRSEKLAAETGSRRGISKDSADANDELARLLWAIRKQLVHD